MRRIDPRLLILLGLTLFFAGALLVADSRPGLAQQGGTEEADYIGADECASCHRNLAREHTNTLHARALKDVSKSKTAITADFKLGEQERTIVFPDEKEPRPFTEKDIYYLIGGSRYVERFVYRIERGKFAVLPAEWDVQKQQWQPYGSAENWLTDPALNFVTSCAGCHVTDLNAERGRWGDDGVQCEACHGPGSIHAEIASDARTNPSPEELAALRAAIKLTPDAQVCGQCHSQGKNETASSPYPVGYRPGADLLDPAVFTLIKNDDPAHWWLTGHGKSNNMQFNEWLQSRHAKALNTLQSSDKAKPECLQCHSADYRLTNLLIAKHDKGDRMGDVPTLPGVSAAQFGVTCLSCHDPHGGAGRDFLLAEADAYTLCTTCHRATEVTEGLHHPVKEMFEGVSVVADIAGTASVHFSEAEGPRCQTCHVPRVPMDGINLASHALKPVLPGKTEGQLPDSCSGCHSDLSPTDLQALIDDIQARVQGRITLAQTRLSIITLPADGSAESIQYQKAVEALAFVLNDGSRGIHNYAYADALLSETERLLSQLSVPGSNLEPTEAPRPTATPSGDRTEVAAKTTEAARTGFRPMTFIVIGSVLLVLLIGALIFGRSSRNRGV